MVLIATISQRLRLLLVCQARKEANSRARLSIDWLRRIQLTVKVHTTGYRIREFFDREHF
jgi:hypothetical protein